VSEAEQRKELFESALQDYWAHRRWPSFTAPLEGLNKLRESIEYSSKNGGKRFRPLSGLFLAEAFGVNPKKVLSYLLAVEFIHTYSLIHDDLPCMDNDEVRRGQPTNHKVFGENIALLAGDGLLTEAFGLIAKSYPGEAAELISILAEAAGIDGMVGGQAVDLTDGRSLQDESGILFLHQLKTAALIRSVFEGVAILIGLPSEKRALCREAGELFGICFQIADDILDAHDPKEVGGLPKALGLSKVEQLLKSKTQQCLDCLEKLGMTDSHLTKLVLQNSSRSI
jgi:geranylgeranyl diphosphate synthase type II